jgi:hypothetical protein
MEGFSFTARRRTPAAAVLSCRCDRGRSGLPDRGRASDAEREAAVARLRDAAGEGRLSLEELAERVEAADGARTRGDLAGRVADLPADDSAGSALPAAQTRRLYGILGGGTLSGPVRLGSEARVINVMGGADLDLTEAVLTEGEVTIRVFSIYGGSNIRLRSVSIMGGTDIKRGPPRPWRWPWKRRERALPPSG